MSTRNIHNLLTKRNGYNLAMSTDEDTDAIEITPDIGNHTQNSKKLNHDTKSNEDIDPNTETIEEQIKIYYKSFHQLTLENIAEREYKYHSDFDKNGILYAIGSNFDLTSKTQWQNPAELKMIKLSSYPNKMYKGLLHDIVGRHGKNCELDSENVKNASFTIDFVELEICPNYYTLRHGYKYPYGYLTSWDFEAKSRDSEWICLDSKRKNSEFKGEDYICASWPINADNYYSKFRIKMTDTDSDGDYYFSCSGFEIYGKNRVNTSIQPSEFKEALNEDAYISQSVDHSDEEKADEMFINNIHHNTKIVLTMDHINENDITSESKHEDENKIDFGLSVTNIQNTQISLEEIKMNSHEVSPISETKDTQINAQYIEERLITIPDDFYTTEYDLKCFFCESNMESVKRSTFRQCSYDKCAMQNEKTQIMFQCIARNKTECKKFYICSSWCKKRYDLQEQRTRFAKEGKHLCPNKHMLLKGRRDIIHCNNCSECERTVNSQINYYCEKCEQAYILCSSCYIKQIDDKYKSLLLYDVLKKEEISMRMSTEIFSSFANDTGVHCDEIALEINEMNSDELNKILVELLDKSKMYDITNETIKYLLKHIIYRILKKKTKNDTKQEYKGDVVRLKTACAILAGRLYQKCQKDAIQYTDDFCQHKHIFAVYLYEEHDEDVDVNNISNYACICNHKLMLISNRNIDVPNLNGGKHTRTRSRTIVNKQYDFDIVVQKQIKARKKDINARESTETKFGEIIGFDYDQIAIEILAIDCQNLNQHWTQYNRKYNYNLIMESKSNELNINEEKLITDIVCLFCGIIQDLSNEEITFDKKNERMKSIRNLAEKVFKKVKLMKTKLNEQMFKQMVEKNDYKQNIDMDYKEDIDMDYVVENITSVCQYLFKLQDTETKNEQTKQWRNNYKNRCYCCECLIITSAESIIPHWSCTHVLDDIYLDNGISHIQVIF